VEFNIESTFTQLPDTLILTHAGDVETRNLLINGYTTVLGQLVGGRNVKEWLQGAQWKLNISPVGSC
jgi:hypothetical protein